MDEEKLLLLPSKANSSEIKEHSLVVKGCMVHSKGNKGCFCVVEAGNPGGTTEKKNS